MARSDTVPAASCENLEGNLGWGLGVLSRALADAGRAATADVPGGPRGFQVLFTAADGRIGTQLAVARKLGIDRTVMTYLLDDLERAGLLQRSPDPNDRRARRLTVTPAGLQLLADLEKRMSAVEDELLGELDEHERRSFRESVRRVAVRLDAGDRAIQCQLAGQPDAAPTPP